MRVSSKGRYGLRLMITLASRYGEGPVSADALASDQDISPKYIHVLMANLRTAGLVRTVRGPHGGYECALPPEEINAFEVVSALEGPILPADCLGEPYPCRRSARCAAHHLWARVKHRLHEELQGATLSELARVQLRLKEEATTGHCPQVGTEG